MSTVATPAAGQQTISVHEQMSVFNHEQVVFCNDNETGLKAIIAVHNTVLGPALGGTRMWMYNTEAEALHDVLRLSRGMTYKAAISGLNLGGGKAVIIGDSRKHKNEALMRRFGKFVNSLAGKYITAEDVGIGTKDMEYVRMETRHVTGLPESYGGGGDPSPVTAYGVFMGMKASAKEAYGSDSLTGKRILVQGVGHVGEHLVKHLVQDGAKVFINDINEERLNNLSDELFIEVRKKRYLSPIYAQMISLAQIERLVTLKDEKSGGAAIEKPKAAPAIEAPVEKPAATKKAAAAKQ